MVSTKVFCVYVSMCQPTEHSGKLSCCSSGAQFIFLSIYVHLSVFKCMRHVFHVKKPWKLDQFGQPVHPTTFLSHLPSDQLQALTTMPSFSTQILGIRLPLSTEASSSGPVFNKLLDLSNFSNLIKTEGMRHNFLQFYCTPMLELKERSPLSQQDWRKHSKILFRHRAEDKTSNQQLSTHRITSPAYLP